MKNENQKEIIKWRRKLKIMRYIFFIPCIILDLANLIFVYIPFLAFCGIKVPNHFCSDVIFKKQENKYDPDEWDYGWFPE